MYNVCENPDILSAMLIILIVLIHPASIRKMVNSILST